MGTAGYSRSWKRSSGLPGVSRLAAALGRAGRGSAARASRCAATRLRDREEVAGLRRADDRVVRRRPDNTDLAGLRGGDASVIDRQTGAAELCVGVTRVVSLGVGEARLDLGNHVPGVRLG